MPLRAFVEGFGGFVGGVLGGLAGAILVNPLAILLGVFVGVPLGVDVSGGTMGADGSYWMALVGEALGILALAGALAAANPEDGGGGEPTGVAVILGFPLAGSVWGYELSAEPEAPESD